MSGQTKIDAALAELGDISGPELLAALHKRKNRTLLESEIAKVHPMTTFTLPADEWAKLKEHVLDGGGVVDDTELARDVLQWMWSDDQAKFWPAAVHLIKARAKSKGHMRALPHGGVSLSGIGSKK